MKSWQVLNTLGLRWCAFRAMYKLKLRSGWFRWQLPSTPWKEKSTENLTRERFISIPTTALKSAEEEADKILGGDLLYFSRHRRKSGFVPDWFKDASDAPGRAVDLRHWSLISDFADGDIKRIWEPSRFPFVYPLVRAYSATGNEKYVRAFWAAVEDWRSRNPPQRGPNWKCGQEIAQRMIAWFFGYQAFLHAPDSTEFRKAMLADMVGVSARRIEANIGYALSQRNNHGISEATGLFTAGIALRKKRWVVTGQELLTQQARELIYGDGSFSQHSTNYHRVMLHDFLWAVQLGRLRGIEFSKDVLRRLRKAGTWLLAMMDDRTGRVPNLGANDGALVLPLTDCDYLDYRPTIQAVGVIVDGTAWLPPGPWDELARWLGADEPTREKHDAIGKSSLFSDGGYALLRHRDAVALFRCPRHFKHRPSHCDLLHVDLWRNGVNLLRDGGTYSYNCQQPWQDYFSSTLAHNTVQFDGRDQMPKLSRFLFGKWPTLEVEDRLEDNPASIAAEFTDWKGCRHRRKMEWTTGGYRITDRVSGFKNRAVLRWRLAPELKWELDGNACRADGCQLRVGSGLRPASALLTTGWESLYYLEKTELPVLEVTARKSPHTFVTDIEFSGA